jgi:hypothetical protein
MWMTDKRILHPTGQWLTRAGVVEKFRGSKDKNFGYNGECCTAIRREYRT